MEHKFQMITIQDVTIGTHQNDDPGSYRVFPLGEPEIRYGCRVCNMGLDEAITLPCPGRTLEEMLDDG